ncbi:MAG: ornithine cyclodeaminase family protein [Desulfobacteraceae bacterium]|nr:ornithine cyclodeaminase family protein [Desulfobacteraceae bacterium]
MLYINASDIVKILSLHEIVDSIEKALLIMSKKQFSMPERFHIPQGNNTLLLMPCFTDKYFGTKLVSVFPDNVQKEKPVIYGNMILNIGDTGEVAAIIDGAKLTAMRTGAVGGLGVRYLAPEKSRSLGIIGAGVQGMHQAVFACSEADISKIYVYDLKEENVKSFEQQVNIWHKDVNIEKVESPLEAIEKSEIVITATTSLEPVIPDNKELLKNKTFIGIGSYKPDMREFSKALFELADIVFVDTMVAKKESGDLATPIQESWIKDDQILEIADLVAEKVLVNKKTEKTQVFKSVGMGLFDLIVAQALFEKAIKLNIGQKIIT